MALASKAFSDLITFTRASTAGYYGSDGLYKTAPSGSPRTGPYADYTPAVITQQNLLTYSEDFSNAAWTKSNSFVQTNLLTYSEQFDNAAWGKGGGASVTANAGTAPDGQLTADKLIPAAINTVHNVFQSSLPSTAGVFSVYAKADGETTISLWLAGASIGYLFDLSAGTASTITGGGTTGTIESVGSGWYRCSIASTTATTTVHIYARTGSAFIGNGTSGVLLWGAQFVQGSVAGNYRATTSSALPILYADYTGTLKAMKLCENTATSSHYLNQSVTHQSGAEVLSIDVKAGERTFMQLNMSDNTTGNAACTFNLSAGTAGSLSVNGSWSAASSTIVSLGNGWYRCNIKATRGAGSQTNCNIHIISSGGASSFAGDGSGGVYVVFSQLNEGSAALPYLTTTASAGLVTTTGPKRGFLVEEQRTNLLVRSNDWSTGWSLLNLTQTPAQAIGPDGTMSMTKIAATASAVSLCAQPSVATSTSQTYSIYAKQGSGPTEANYFAVYNNTTASNLAMLTINYSTGAITQTNGTGAYAENVGNGIWRIVIPVTSGITVGNSINGYFGFVGGPETAGEYAYAYGAQMEAGAFATSYIPTTTAQVTRAADVPSVDTFSPWFNSAAGTIYVEATEGLGFYPSLYTFENTASASANRIYTYRNSPTSTGTTNFGTTVDSGGVNSANLATPATNSTKSALTFSENSFAFVVNGGTVLTDTAGAVPVGMNKLWLGWNSVNVRSWNGHLRVMRFYARVFSAPELVALTTA